MNQETNAMMIRFRPLYEAERISARRGAEKDIQARIGDAPTPEQFMRASTSQYPRAFISVVYALCIIVLVAAFLPSAMRLHFATMQVFMRGLPHAESAAWAAAAFVVLAEATQIISTLALTLQKERALRIALYATATLATCIAITGNVYIAQPPALDRSALTWESAFAWLEAASPSLIVLSIAHVLKTLIVSSIEQQHNANIAYAQARAGWEAAMQSPAVEHADWMPAYANALREAMRRAYARSAATRADATMLPDDAWRILVQRELQAEQWYVQAPVHVPAALLSSTMEPIPNAPASRALQQRLDATPLTDAPAPRAPRNVPTGNSTGEVQQAMLNAVEDERGVTVQCPRCTVQYTKDNAKSARLALTAHMRAQHRQDATHVGSEEVQS